MQTIMKKQLVIKKFDIFSAAVGFIFFVLLCGLLPVIYSYLLNYSGMVFIIFVSLLGILCSCFLMAYSIMSLLNSEEQTWYVCSDDPYIDIKRKYITTNPNKKFDRII